MEPNNVLQVAAAIAINGAKPGHMSIQEYLQSLSQHVTICQENGRTHKCLDHSTFWQSEHDVIQGRLEQALDEVFTLRQHNQALESQVTDLQTNHASTRKRKSGDSADGGVAKRRKNDSPMPQIPDALDPVQEVPSTKAMRHLHRVQSLCKGQMYGTEVRELAYHLIQAVEALTLVVENLPRGPDAARGQLRATTVSLARSCISVYHGLKRLSTLPGSGNIPSHVVYACVCFFDSLFTSIEEAASNFHKAQVSSAAEETSETLSLLTALAMSLVSNLQDSSTTCTHHADILEGLTTHMLQRLGEVTRELLLDGPHHPDIEHEIDNLPLPEDKRLDPVRLASLTSMTVQAPYMLAVLKRAITSATCLSTSLVNAVKTKLQKTLVQCIFGTGNGSSAFDDVLRVPEALGSPPVFSVRDIMDDMEKAKNAFEAELWALVGWDILGRDENL